MNVKRWMSQPPITVSPDEPVELAHRKMVGHEIRRLPVVMEDGEIVGIISERDARIVLRPQEEVAAHRDIVPQDGPYLVRDVMTKAVVSVSPNDSVREAVGKMRDSKISGLPVVEGNRCVGLITIQDLLPVLYAALDLSRNEPIEKLSPGASRR